MKNAKLSLFRRDKLGFIFQDYNLLDTLTVKENILLPVSLGKKSSVIFTTSSKLQAGAYLKVWAKGAYTESWKEIKSNDVPKSIKWQ